MTAPVQSITADQRRELEAIYRQQVGAIKALARLLGYPCPIASREERRAAPYRTVDDCAILDTDAAWSSGSSSGS